MKITDAVGSVVYDNLVGATDAMGNGQPIGGGRHHHSLVTARRGLS